MAMFSYQGRNMSGESVKGVLEATDATAVAEQLSRQQVIVTTISPAKAGAGDGIDYNNLSFRELFGGSAVSLDDLIILCRQMYALMRAGVPMLRAINGLVESCSGLKLQKALSVVGTQLESGHALSSALNQHPKIFSPLFVAIIHVGENTGQLDNAFLKLASYFEREQETRKRIKTALRYPTFVLIAITVAVVILNIFVIPTFANMFAKLGADLPLMTKVLINTSNAFVNYWPHMLVVVAIMFMTIRGYLKTQAGSYRWDRHKLKMPIIGSIIERSILSRFTHSFAIVLRAGVPMTSGLSLVADAVDNSYMQEKIVQMRSSIESGESLLRTAVASKMFTPLVLQMIAVGEETGKVDDLLEEVSGYYEREVDYDLNTLTARIEPLLLLVVAGIVLVLALGIFTPMWDMTSAMQGK